MGERIAILSGKGGTGKTSVCAGIAQALSTQGQTVLCIDCDIGLRNLDIALGLSELDTLSFWEVARGEYSLDHATTHPVFPSLHFLTAPMNCSADGIDTHAFKALLDEAALRYDYVLLDAPAGIEAGFTLAASYADRILLVTGPDPAAVRDAVRSAQILTAMDKSQIRLIVNRITPKLAQALNITVDDIMDEAGLPLMGIVPEDKNVTLAAAFHQPLLGYSKKGAAAACRRIARRIRGLHVPITL